jgi:hypothetical protein
MADGWVEPHCHLPLQGPTHIPGCSFLHSRADLVTTGRTTPWKPEPARIDGSVPEEREVEALGSSCSLRGQPPGLIH